jgi:hypothetical protein
MAFSLKREWGFFFSVIIIAFLAIGIIYLNNQNNTLRKENQNQVKELDILTTQIEDLTILYNQKQEENILLRESLNHTSQELEQYKQNMDILSNRVNELTANQTFLHEEVKFYEDIMDIIGVEDVENVLIAYGMQAKELEELQRQYDTLLKAYNYLINQQS